MTFAGGTLHCLGEDLFVNIRIGRNLLNVVDVVQRIHKLDELLGVPPFDTDLVLGNPDKLGPLELDSSRPHARLYFVKRVGIRRNDELIPRRLDILRSRLDCGLEDHLLGEREAST